jgi:hypothetical protein
MFFGFRQAQQYFIIILFCYDNTFGQLTIIRPSVQNSEQGAT